MSLSSSRHLPKIIAARRRARFTVRALPGWVGPFLAGTSLVAASLLPAGCLGVGGTNVRSNGDIPAEVRAEISVPRDQFLDAVRRSDEEAAKRLFTDDARAQIEAGMGWQRLLAATKEVIDPGTMEVIEEHYVRHKTAGVHRPVVVIREPEAHTFTLPTMSGEGYLVLLGFDQGHRRSAVGLLFGKPSDSWKIWVVSVGGMYSVGGKTAREWYTEARSYEARGALVPAALRMEAAAACQRPIPTMQYGFERECQKFGKDLFERFGKKFVFPIRLTEVPGDTRILRIDVSYGKGLLVPIVEVLTPIPLSDTARLEAEAVKIGAALAAHLPGYCEGTSTYMLVAYNEEPVDSQKTYQRYGLQRTCP